MAGGARAPRTPPVWGREELPDDFSGDAPGPPGEGGTGRRDVGRWVSGLLILLATACSSTASRPRVPPVPSDDHGRPARLLSAFFGLDNDLPFRAHMLCLGAAGKDGMPVVSSHTLDAGDFRVVTRSGEAERELYRVTVQRADGRREEIAPAALDADLRQTRVLLDQASSALARAVADGDMTAAEAERVGDLVEQGVLELNPGRLVAAVKPLEDACARFPDGETPGTPQHLDP